MVDVADQVYSKTLGQGSILEIKFRFSRAGTVVDLQADGYTVDVYVEDQAGTVTGPTAATVSGTEASYLMQATDLDTQSATDNEYVRFVAVATNGTSKLVSDARAIKVGAWGGA